MSLFVHDSKGQISEEAQVTVTVAATLVARTRTRRSGHAYPRLWHGSVDRELLLGRVSLARWRHLLVRVELPGPRVGILQRQYRTEPIARVLSTRRLQRDAHRDRRCRSPSERHRAGHRGCGVGAAAGSPIHRALPRWWHRPGPPFDVSASTTGNGQPVAVYSWTFGDGGTASGAVVNHDFLNAGTFQVTLRVEDSAGRYATATQNVVVLPFVAPTDFRLVGSRSYVPCLFFGCPGARTGYFDFGWTNQPKSPGDTVSHEINVTVLQGCVAWADQTRTYSTNAAGTWQVVRWEEPTTNPFDFSTQICVGSVYNYKMRVKRVNSLGTLYSPWSPTQRVTA
ncbi:MAG: PKD domain-containing protein [Cypionkella sp.]